MKAIDIFPSKYLKAEHLNGREPTVTISHCEIQTIKNNKTGKDDQKLIIYFEGKELGLVCNRTNYDRIAYLYGDETDDWGGKKVTLFTEMVQTPEGIKPGLRVKNPPGVPLRKQVASENPAEGLDDEIPF